MSLNPQEPHWNPRSPTRFVINVTKGSDSPKDNTRWRRVLRLSYAPVTILGKTYRTVRGAESPDCSTIRDRPTAPWNARICLYWLDPCACEEVPHAPPGTTPHSGGR